MLKKPSPAWCLLLLLISAEGLATKWTELMEKLHGANPSHQFMVVKEVIHRLENEPWEPPRNPVEQWAMAETLKFISGSLMLWSHPSLYLRFNLTLAGVDPPKDHECLQVAIALKRQLQHLHSEETAMLDIALSRLSLRIGSYQPATDFALHALNTLESIRSENTTLLGLSQFQLVLCKIESERSSGNDSTEFSRKMIHQLREATSNLEKVFDLHHVKTLRFRTNITENSDQHLPLHLVRNILGPFGIIIELRNAVETLRDLQRGIGDESSAIELTGYAQALQITEEELSKANQEADLNFKKIIEAFQQNGRISVVEHLCKRVFELPLTAVPMQLEARAFAGRTLVELLRSEGREAEARTAYDSWASASEWLWRYDLVVDPRRARRYIGLVKWEFYRKEFLQAHLERAKYLQQTSTPEIAIEEYSNGLRALLPGDPPELAMPFYFGRANAYRANHKPFRALDDLEYVRKRIESNPDTTAALERVDNEISSIRDGFGIATICSRAAIKAVRSISGNRVFSDMNR